MSPSEWSVVVERLSAYAAGVVRLCAHYYGSPWVTIKFCQRSLAAELESTPGYYHRASTEELSRVVREFGAAVTEHVAGGGGATSEEFERARREHPELFEQLVKDRDTFLQDLARLDSASSAGLIAANGTPSGVAEVGAVRVLFRTGFQAHLD